MKKFLFLLLILVFPLNLHAEEEAAKESSAEDKNSSYEEYYEALRKKYEELVDESGKRSSDAYEWVQKDFKNMFSWEYKVVTFSLEDEVKLNDELEKLGVERWELVQAVPHGAKEEARFFFKRRPKSYLKSIPLKDLLRLLPTGGDGGGGGE